MLAPAAEGERWASLDAGHRVYSRPDPTLGGHMRISVEVTGTQEEQLAEFARRLNVAPDALALAALRDLLAQREPDFLTAATRVLEKNRDLYKRLS